VARLYQKRGGAASAPLPSGVPATTIFPVGDAPEIRGSCDARYAGVREALAENFRAHGEVGAAVAVTLDGRPVVDLWAGWADGARTRPWRPDTLVDVFSAGKAMAAVVLLRLVERGRLALDQPVARWWPEFAARGKDDVTVRMVLSHRAAVPGIRRPLPALAMYDWTLMTDALAAEEPWWPPGATHGYHVNTFGFLVGELVRRASGERLRDIFRRTVAEPLAADFHFGVDAAADGRVAEYLLPDRDDQLADHLIAGEARAGAVVDDARRAVLHAVYANPSGISGFGTVNTPEWRAAEIPSTNGHASARGLARVYTALACGGVLDGVHVLEPETIEGAIAEAATGPDRVLGRPSRFGLGVQLTQPERPLGTNARSFGHFGAGGSLGFADPDARLAFAYVMNNPGPRWQNPRNRALIDAVYAAV